MGYLIEQILLCLLLAFILGLIIGWIWKRIKASGEISRLNGEIEHANKEKAEAFSHYEATKQEFETHRLNSQSTIDDLNLQVGKIKPLESEVTESKSQIASLTSKLGVMETDHKKLDQKYKTEAESLSQKFAAEKEAAVAAVKKDVEKHKKDLSTLAQQHQEQTASLKAQVTKADSEISRIGKEKQSELEQLKKQLEEQNKTVADQKAALSQALGNVKKASEDIENLKKQNQKETASLKSQFDASKSELAKVSADRDSKLSALTNDLQTAKSEYKSRELQDRELREKDTAIERLQSQLRAQASLDKEVADAKSNLDKAKSEAKQKDQDLVAAKNKVTILEQNLKSAQSSKENSGEIQKELDALKKQLSESQSALNSCRQSGQSQQQKISELQSRLDKAQTDKNAAQQSNRPAVSSAAPTTGSGKAATPAKRTPLFTAPAEKDDLKLIYGIGPVMEGILNELGITSFKQISEFTKSDIERVAKAIDTFPDRIERDDWVGGAKMEYQKKYHGKS